MPEQLRRCLARPLDAASLAAFRAVFGGLVFVGTVRLLAKGFVREAFIVPHIFFPPWPFEDLIRPLPGIGMYVVFVAIALSALALSLGLVTRLAAALVCVLFTYAHFVDLTNYLNHYWLVTLLAGLLVVVPAGETLSLDAHLWPSNRRHEVPAWGLYLLRFQVAVVYFFAGFAKLKHDWFFDAQPLWTWLLANTDTPILGSFFRYEWVAYAMSWGGAFFDLTIVAWLLWRRSRPLGYAAVVVFHLLTARLFNIGMFPFFMIAASLLFLDPGWPRRFLHRRAPVAIRQTVSRVPWVPLTLYAAVQIAVPLRSFLYGGNVLWHEQGYRFSWNVMLMEKMGSAEFSLVDRASGTRRIVRMRDHVTPSQEKALATQPDMLLAFARHLKRAEAREGRDIEVHADVFVVLNGKRSARLLDPNVDLSSEEDGLASKTWILPWAQP